MARRFITKDMRASALESMLVLGAWPANSFACMSPNPKLLAWGKCAIGRSSLQGRTDIVKWTNAIALVPQPKNVGYLRQRAQRWVSSLNRACGSYAAVRNAEAKWLTEHGMAHDAAEQRDYDELDTISYYLLCRKRTGPTTMDECAD